MSEEMSGRPVRRGSEFTLAQLLEMFAFATDLAFGLELEDGLRACFLAAKLAEEMGLAPADRLTVYYTAFLKDAGCTCWTTQFADFWQTNEKVAMRELFIFSGPPSLRSYVSFLLRYPGADLPMPARLQRIIRILAGGAHFYKEGGATAVEVCSRIARRLGLPASVQEAALSLGESWNGKGLPRGLRGEEIPLAARIVLPTYILAPVHRAGGRAAAKEAAVAGRGKVFAPEVVDAFLALSARDSFWEELEREGISERVLALEPDSDLATVGEDRLDDLALAFADFVDLKSPFAAAHSRRVGQIAERIAGAMGCPDAEVERFRRAGLMHDLGLVALPSQMLNKPEGRLGASEREQLRLHSYYGERILGRAPVMADLTPLVGAHHERLDGAGYFRGLRDRDIPLGGRIVAVANRFDEISHDAPGQPGLPLEDALAVLNSEAGAALDREVVRTLRACLGQSPGDGRPHKEWPAGLTNREVEVLRLAARGLTRRQVAERLVITENTVRHHLEHIYNKTGTSTRVAATLFAMEHDLIP
jgi:HD-GYP domain-containing protein (c-di-GMP phosphodiesterase class II)